MNEKEMLKQLKKIRKTRIERPVTISPISNPVEFIFINNKMEFKFDESVNSRAVVSGTLMELSTPSLSGNFYSMEESENITSSFRGVPIYEGVGKFNEHIYDRPPVGFVVGVKRLGRGVYGVCSISNRKLIEKLKAGVKFLFSVAGNALYSETIKIGNKLVRSLHDIRINSLQIVPSGVKVGFPSAQLDRLISVQETLMLDTPKDIMGFGLMNVLQSKELNQEIGKEIMKLVRNDD